MRAEKRRDRIQIVLSDEMVVALNILSERNGLAPATQAMVSLKQALQRTIDSEECRDRLRIDGSFLTRQEWLTNRENRAYVQNAEAKATRSSQDAQKAQDTTTTP